MSFDRAPGPGSPHRPAAPALAEGEPILERYRNSTLASLAGSMRRRGMSAAAIEAALQVTNDERCAPPLEAREVRGIAVSIARYAPADVPPDRPARGAGPALIISIGWEAP
jgi:putative DNA primase/helicase